LKKEENMIKKSKGFTLIELLIVVAIIGILAALLIPNAMTAIQKAKQKGTMKDVATISTAMVDYVTEQAATPTQSGAIDATFAANLAPFYLKICPLTDQWGNPFEVYSGQAAGAALARSIVAAGLDNFIVQSLGRNGADDGWVYAPGTPEDGMYIVETAADFARDIVNNDGSLIHGPWTRK
jgi:type II secretion system protein G